MQTSTASEDEPPTTSITPCHKDTQRLKSPIKPMSSLTDDDFKTEGGFEKAYWILIYEANEIIKKRSSLTAGGAEVALMQPSDLVGYAIGRYLQKPGVSQEGRTVFEQLWAYMDDHAHSLRYGKKYKNRVHFHELQKEEAEIDADDFQDHKALDPLTDLEKREQADADQRLIKEVRFQFSKNSDEHRIIDTLLDGVETRAEAIAKLKMPAPKYDAAIKRIERASMKIKAKFAKKE